MSSFISRTFFLLLALSLPAAASEKPSSIRIGYQKFSTLSYVRSHKTLDQRLEPLGIKVEWIAFPAGPQLLEALGVNGIVFGETGNSPPIFAQAAGIPFVYAAYRPANNHIDGIVVPKGSSIQSLKDLKGKKVAVTKGSSSHWLLLKALESAGLTFQDIQPVYLPPPDALPAFLSNRIDAWAIWEPYKTVVVSKNGARQLTDSEGISQAYGFYLARRDFAENHPDLLKIIKEEIQTIEKRNDENKQAAAEEAAAEIRIPVDVLLSISQKNKPGIFDITPEVISYQQEIADKFLEIGLIQKKLVVSDALPQPK
ncbi:MAG: aliphatic sulfonate ABC transporter substrate-binding protein [Luteolibacter sp.]